MQDLLQIWFSKYKYVVYIRLTFFYLFLFLLAVRFVISVYFILISAINFVY